MKLHSVKRKSIDFIVVVLTIIIFSGCGGITKQVVDPGEKGAFIKIIINDAKIKDATYGSRLVNKLKEAFGKTFKNVSIRTGYSDPKHGEYVITPLELKLCCVQEPWEYFKGSRSRVTLKIPDCNKPTIFKAESKFEITNNKESNSYSFINKGSYEPSVGGAFLQLPLAILSSSAQMALWKNTASGQALESIAIDLQNKIVSSSEFRTYAELAKLSQTAAASLNIGVKFSDANSIIPNNTIDAAEQSTITTTITNFGKGTAFDVRLHTKSNYNHIHFPKTISVGDIQPGELKDIKINIKADLDLNTGIIPFLISCTEKRGYDARKINLKVPATRLERPKMVVASYKINDGSTGLAKGNGNGIPENGETIEITAFVKNEGVGDALNVTLVLEDAAPEIEIVQRESSAGTISPGQSAKAKLAFHIPRTFSGNALSFKLAASEVRLGPSATKEVALRYESNMPVLASASRILRGGEEILRLVNGKSFELEITPKNHGTLSAKNIRLRVNSHDLNYSSDTVNIGDLKPGTSGSPQWFDLHIPRAFTKSKLTIELSLDQSDFAGKTNTIEIPVAVIAPKLAYTAAVSGRHGGNTIEQGERAYFEVQVQNSGGLEARNVRLKLDIANPNVKIMDENERVIPHIAASTFSETLKFDLLVLRKVQPGELPVRIFLTQADFPNADFEHKLMVKDEGAEMIKVAAATGAKARHIASSGSMGPVLAIARPQNGLRVYDDNLDISGTVVDARGIDRIEVKINGRQKSVTIASASTINRKEFFASLLLKNGENRIVVAAYNNNDVRSEKVRIVYKAQAVGNQSHILPLSLFCDVDKRALELPAVGRNADHKKWAVVIGVEKYRRAPSVPYALRDAQAVYEYFTKLFRIPAENCFVLFDEQATLGEFRGLFEGSLPSLVRKGDTVYCYFAGHGVPDVGDQTPYLLPYDGKPSNPKWTAYASADLYASLGRLKAKNVFVFLDACFSGSAGRSPDQKPLFKGARPGLVKIKDQILSQKNLALFAAAKSNQISNAYQEKQHGLFTYFLLKGLGGESASNKKGVIRVKDLADYVKTNVHNISRRFGANLAQTPVIKGRREKEDLVIVGKMP
jgi:uncharacterized membrane protein